MLPDKEDVSWWISLESKWWRQEDDFATRVCGNKRQQEHFATKQTTRSSFEICVNLSLSPLIEFEIVFLHPLLSLACSLLLIFYFYFSIKSTKKWILWYIFLTNVASLRWTTATTFIIMISNNNNKLAPYVKFSL